MHPLIVRSIWNSLKVMRKSSNQEKNWVCKLQKSLYSLKQSGRNWNAYLTENGFKQKPADNCRYTGEKQDEKVFMIVWIGDLIITANTEEVMKSVKMMFTERCKMKT